jgi:hypothetical protein
MYVKLMTFNNMYRNVYIKTALKEQAILYSVTITLASTNGS